MEKSVTVAFQTAPTVAAPPITPTSVTPEINSPSVPVVTSESGNGGYGFVLPTKLDNKALEAERRPALESKLGVLEDQLASMYQPAQANVTVPLQPSAGLVPQSLGSKEEMNNFINPPSKTGYTKTGNF